MKFMNNFTQRKNRLVNVTFARAITHEKHLKQSGRSTRSAADIYNTLRVFANEPVIQSEYKLSWSVWLRG